MFEKPQARGVPDRGKDGRERRDLIAFILGKLRRLFPEKRQP
jgi:hypothetical protein